MAGLFNEDDERQSEAGGLPALVPGRPDAFAATSSPSNGLPLASTGPVTGLPFTGSPSTSPLPIQGQMSEFANRIAAQAKNPVSAFFSRLGGVDPNVEAMKALTTAGELGLRGRGQELQEQQFGLSKKLAAGQQLVGLLEAAAKATPDVRASMFRGGVEALGPIFDALGYKVPPSLLNTFVNESGTATKWGALVTSRVGADRAQQYLPIISGMSDPTKIHDLIDKVVESSIGQVMPGVQARLSQVAGLIRGDRSSMTNLGLVDEQGAMKLIPAQTFVGVLDSAFNDPIEKAAAARILSDDKHKGFLASIGIEPGSVPLGNFEAFAKRTGEKAGEQAAAPAAAITFHEGQFFRQFKDTTKPPEQIKDVRSLGAADQQRVKVELQREARERVLARFKGPLGAINLGDTPPDKVDADIEATYQDLLSQHGLGGKAKAKPAPTGKMKLRYNPATQKVEPVNVK